LLETSLRKATARQAPDGLDATPIQSGSADGVNVFFP
jgi:hypothetical protein